MGVVETKSGIVKMGSRNKKVIGTVTHTIDIREHFQFGRDTSMYTEELLVDKGGNWKRLERKYACIVDCRRVLVQTWIKVSKRRRYSVDSNTHSLLNVKYSVRCLHSWFPRRRRSVFGYHSFNAYR